MPVILRIKGYRFWFYEADLDEPPHVHVSKDGKQGKFWLTPISLARASRFRDHEINEIYRILKDFQDDIFKTWQKEQEKRGDR